MNFEKEATEKWGMIEFEFEVKHSKSNVELPQSSVSSVPGTNLSVIVVRPSPPPLRGLFICLYNMKVCMPSEAVDFTFDVKKADGTDLCRGDFRGVHLKRSEYSGGLLLSQSAVESAGNLKVTFTMRASSEADSTARLDTLSKEMGDLFLSQRAADVKLIVNHEEIPAHKSILSARSTVFATMFEVDMKEKMTGIVNIKDFPAEPFRNFLLYLYSGKIENLSRTSIDLYKIADEYDVQSLKEACVRYLQGSVSMDNIFDVLLLADVFDEKDLKNSIQEFFNENFCEIVRSPKWKSFLRQNFDLGNDLLIKMKK